MIGSTKRKIVKKEMKKDALIEKYFQARELITENQRTVISIGAAVLAVVVIIVLLINRSNSQNEKASAEYGKILQVYNSGAYQQAIDGIPQKNLRGLKFIVSEYGSTNTGEDAKILLANSYLFLGKYDEALKGFDDYSGSNKLLKTAAYAGMASCYELKKNLDDAASYYLKAANVTKDELTSPDYLVNAARCFSLVNKKDQAKKAIEQLKKDYSTTTQARDYERYYAEFQLN